MLYNRRRKSYLRRKLKIELDLVGCWYVRSELCSVFKATVSYTIVGTEKMGLIMKKVLDLRTTFIFTLACLVSMTTAGIWEQSIIISFAYNSNIKQFLKFLKYVICKIIYECFTVNATACNCNLSLRIKQWQLCLGNSWSSFLPRRLEHIWNYQKIFDFFY